MLSKLMAAHFSSLLIAIIAALAALSSASMLAGVFVTLGQPGGPISPHSGVGASAVAALIGATAGFYFALGLRERSAPGPRAAALVIVLLITLFGSVTQIFIVVDGASGGSSAKSMDTKAGRAFQQAQRIDQGITRLYYGQIEYLLDRLDEEAAKGLGSRYRGMENAFNTLRATFDSALGTSAALSGTNEPMDLAALADAIEDLRGKADAFERFAAEIGLRGPDFGEQVAALAREVRMERRALACRQISAKLSEMVASAGMADLGFSLAVLFSLVSDAIQVLCIALLLSRRKNGASAPPSDPALEPGEYWEPQEHWEPDQTAGNGQFSPTIH